MWVIFGQNYINFTQFFLIVLCQHVKSEKYEVRISYWVGPIMK